MPLMKSLAHQDSNDPLQSTNEHYKALVGELTCVFSKYKTIGSEKIHTHTHCNNTQANVNNLRKGWAISCSGCFKIKGIVVSFKYF